MSALGGNEVFKLFGTIEVGRQKFAGDMKAMEKSVGSFAAKATRGFDKVTKGIERHRAVIQSVGRGLTAGVTLPLLAAGVAAVKFSTDFAEGLANVATLLPGETERVLELGDAVKGLSVATGKGLGDLTEGLYQTISAFGDAADTERKLQVVTQAGVAGRASTVEALNLLSAVTKGYGDTSAEALEHVSDLAFVTVQLGQTTFPELAGSIGRVVPLAEAMGVSLEELFAVMATGTGVVGTANEVGTQFRGVLNALMNPQKQMIELLKKHEYASGRAMIADLGFGGSLRLIKEESEASGHEMIEYITMVEALPLAFALSGAQADVLIGKLEKMGVATGASEEAFLIQTTGINKAGFAIGQMKARVVVLATNLGDKLTPALMDVMDALEPTMEKLETATERFGQLEPATRKAALGIAGFTAVLGPILMLLPSFIASLGGAAAVLGGPLGVIFALAGVAASLIYGRTHWIRYWQAADRGKQVLSDEIQAHVDLKIAIGREIQARNDLRQAELSHRDVRDARVAKAQTAHDIAIKQLGVIETKYYRLTNAAKNLAQEQADADQALLDAAAAAEAAAAAQGKLGKAVKLTNEQLAEQKRLAQLAVEQAEERAQVIIKTMEWAEAQQYLWEQMGGEAGVAAVEALRRANSELGQSEEHIKAVIGAWTQWEAETGGFSGLAQAITDANNAEVLAAAQAAEWAFEQMGGEAGVAQYEEAKEAADKAYEESKARAERTALAWERAAERIQNALADAFAKIILEGGKFSDVLSTLWDTMKRAFAEALAAMLAEWIATQMKMLAIKLITSIFGGWFGGGGVVEGKGGGGVDTSGPQWAQAGALAVAPSLIGVGEAGPEAILPLPLNPAVISALPGGEGMSGGLHVENLTVELTADSLDPVGVERLGTRLVAPLGEALRRSLLSQVVGA